ncbi:dicarboxylate/amino acid:cation symporter [Chondrinema litorale]|uniref:dicarboxylate/amino acid:cation symporter n=1 Tax=Chondrinema litorale TaxID=2994555 RepID=UPI002542CAC3|nr:dicarboxylate/amino acid:cation symporter [Chondrinema litorale]UZR93196.1 dicarboxylate/amino acid:cation symporter [Chondrinema litorale]
MKKIAIHWQIIIGMVLGIVVGLILISAGWGQFSNDWIKPFGKIFINSLKLIAVPLVLFSLVKGITSLTDVSQLSSMGGKTVLIYVSTTIVAVTLGLLLVNITNPGKGFTEETRKEFSANYASDTEMRAGSAKEVQGKGPLQPLVDVVTDNIFVSFADNAKMLQVIFFAILFGVAMVMVNSPVVEPIKRAFDGLNEIVIQMVNIIMLFAPFGVFALLCSLLVDIAGDNPDRAVELLGVLAQYSLTVVFGLGLMIFGFYPMLVRVFGKFKYKDFFSGIFPAQMMAFSTSSSAATLPVTMERVEKHLGVSNETASFVLPLGATVNMDGTSLYQGVAAVFIAQAYGLDLTIGQQLGIVVTATLASIGSAAVPGAGIVMLVIVLEQAKIPVEGIALILAPDRILDMCRTVVNVTGDATVCMLVEKTKKKSEIPSESVKV